MSLWLAVLLALGAIVLLFVVAATVERSGKRLARRPGLRLGAYTLSLGVYCSSWTFYGAVGSAVRDGWAYLPIYAGPILLLLCAPRFLTLLARAVADEQASTVSDFIAARFGHDVVVARLVTVIALLGTVPYVALQVRSVGSALSIASGQPVELPAMVATAMLLALFAILFGARRFQLAGRSEGLVYAIGLESVIKLATLTTVAALAFIALRGAASAQASRGMALLAAGFSAQHISGDVPIIALISVMAVIVLPRQFHMGLVEAQQPDDLRRARFGLAAYIGAMALLIVPLALAGTTLLARGVSADVYVLALPSALGHGWVLGAALVGGISAASSMAIVDATALATMVSNDLIFPTIMRGASAEAAGAIGARMLTVRRVSIIVIMAAALAWALLVSPSRSLASIGLVAFAAMAQFTPHLILAALRGGNDPWAGRVSLGAGLALWIYTLGLPPILPVHWLVALAGGPFDPLHLLGSRLGSPLAHGVIWSLGVNLVVLALVSLRKASPRQMGVPIGWPIRSRQRVSNIGDLARLTAAFVGKERVEREFPASSRAQPVDRTAAHRAQELIATVIGASPARALVASALASGQMSLAAVTRLLGEGGQSLRFSRQLLAATFENMDAGISVVDAELNLVAWNTRYLDLFAYPPGMVRAGMPVADLIRYNALRGDFGAGDADFHVAKRLKALRRRVEHSFERHRRDGRVVKTVGGPMPGGGYVTSFTDITEEARIRAELTATLAELEQRVGDRTVELSDANRRLAEATRDKTRFLAAASHDLLQPLHAARLFTAALARDTGLTRPELVGRVERSIVAAENLLRALLDISKLDAGGVQPAPEPIDLAPFLRDIAEGVRPLAEEQGLTLRLGPLTGAVESDPGLLRSVLQNFLTNAVRYTPHGGILLGVRQRGAELRIDVIDTGIGIPPDQQQAIFTEFTRLGELDAEGLGLGLAIARRITWLLGGRIELVSTPGRGSRFSLALPARAAIPLGEAAPVRPTPGAHTSPLAVLVVDNQPEIVAASLALLAGMGHHGMGAATPAEALRQAGAADVVLADYDLGRGEDGLSLIAALRALRPGLPAALVTAVRERAVLASAELAGIIVLAKPVAPEAIEAFLAEVAPALA